ncbi:MAG TPA: hypothetical protein DCQ37_18840 [Desulfobacteraceae bacterium]|nr:hypothetical protein [Desulfobacteraceae bacterium]
MKTARITVALLAAIALSIVLSVSVDAAERRLALVIGNADYKIKPYKPLANPVNDAKDMEDALRKLNFEVIAKFNADQKEMEDAITDFGKRLRNADVGLFYFSGHGQQYNDQNYLIPLNASISEATLKYKAVPAGMVVEEMNHSGCRLSILILDACRYNPYITASKSARKGFAPMDPPKGMLIAYATAPNTFAYDDSIGKNSIYTGTLLKQMSSGEMVEQVFKNVRIEVMNITKSYSDGQQVPWELTCLTGNFYFSKAESQPEKSSDPANAASKRQTPVEPEPMAVQKYPLRSKPMTVSDDEGQSKFKLNDKWRPLEYIQNDFKDNGDTITDRATGLMWQKSGSDKYMPYKDAKAYIDGLNSKNFAGYSDWRLPTVDELKSLLMPEKQSNDLYINPIFDKNQSWCWTSDTRASGGAWFVNFFSGLVNWFDDDNYYVRAVRSRQ